MKKNKMMRLASGLLVAVLLTTSMISGTFAKYVSTASGSDTARVAKWDIEVNDNKLAVKNAEVKFDLFGTIKDSNGDNETDVKKGSETEKIIAPGTKGSFEFKIENLSEVNAKYTIEFEETNAGNVPIQYSVDGNTWVDSADDLETSVKDKEINMGEAAKAETVYWRWVYEGGTGSHAGQTDETDTALGLKGTDTVMIKATITVTQVD